MRISLISLLLARLSYTLGQSYHHLSLMIDAATMYSSISSLYSAKQTVSKSFRKTCSGSGKDIKICRSRARVANFFIAGRHIHETLGLSRCHHAAKRSQIKGAFSLCGGRFQKLGHVLYQSATPDHVFSSSTSSRRKPYDKAQ